MRRAGASLIFAGWLPGQERPDIPEENTMNEATRITAKSELGASTEEFQNLHEFVRKARANLNQNAWDYIVGAAETETTMRRNRMALDEIAFRPRVLRDVAQRRCVGRAVRPQIAPAGGDGAGRRARDLRSRRRRSQRRAWRRQVRRRPHAELGVRAGPREGRRGRARRVAHLSALRPRRRRLCRGSRQPRDRKRLYRVLPDRRHRALQPARARYRQALRPRKPPARHRRRLPEGAGVAHRQADQGQVQDPAGPQGYRHRRGRRHCARSRGRVDLRFEPWRTPARSWPRRDACAARDRRCRAGPREDHGRRLVLPRHRHRQGDRDGRRSRRHRPPAMLGAGRCRRRRASCGCWSCWRTK